MIEPELITAHEMCKRLKISFESFRKTKWRRWKHEIVGRSDDIRSARFYWCAGPVKVEEEVGSIKISDQKRDTLAGRNIQRRRENGKQGRIHNTPGGAVMGRRTKEIEAAAKRFGFA